MTTGSVSVSRALPLRALGWTLESLVAALRVVWCWAFGAALCTTLVGSLVALGWTQRLVRRVVARRWWSGREPYEGFERFAGRTRLGDDWTGAPRWVLGPERDWRGVRAIARSLLGSLGANLSLGVRTATAALLATAPGWSLWVFAWHAGWNNSFHKGYEQAWVGPVTGIAGSALFATLLLYVPVAQVRLAVTDRWRSFFDVRVVRAVVRERWLACLGLAVLYGLGALPVMVFRAAPTFVGNLPAVDAMGDDEFARFQALYRFGAGLLVFPWFVLLRWYAALVYAAALPRLLERGALRSDQLDPAEVEVLELQGVTGTVEETSRPWLLRLVAWGGTRAGRVTSTALAFAIWGAFVFSIFVAQFLAYVPLVGWIVHPLVQVPWLAVA